MVESGGLRRMSRRRARNVSGGRPFRHVVRVSESEETQLVVAAARQGVTILWLLIVCALERSDEITSADKRELLVELFTIHRLLGNMANNINQIARAVNSTGGKRAEDLQHEPAHRVLASRGVGMPFFDEVNGSAPGEDLVHELLKVDERSGKAVNGGHPDSIVRSHVPQALGEARTVGARTTADLVLEQSIDWFDRLELTG